MRYGKPLTIIAGVLIALTAGAASADGWVGANGQKCSDVCKAESNMYAVRTGSIAGQGEGYVCAAAEPTEHSGGGKRAGWNSENIKTCNIWGGSGGKTLGVYSCLCTKKQVTRP